MAGDWRRCAMGNVRGTLATGFEVLLNDCSPQVKTARAAGGTRALRTLQFNSCPLAISIAIEFSL